jgi:hypothetical protein
MIEKDNDKMRKISIVMERFWLALAIASLAVVIYFFLVDGVNRVTLQYLVFPALAGLMYGFRATFRRRHEKRNDPR